MRRSSRIAVPSAKLLLSYQTGEVELPFEDPADSHESDDPVSGIDDYLPEDVSAPDSPRDSPHTCPTHSTPVGSPTGDESTTRISNTELATLLRVLPRARVSGSRATRLASLVDWVQNTITSTPGAEIELRKHLDDQDYYVLVAANRPGWRVRPLLGGNWVYHTLPLPVVNGTETLGLLLQHMADMTLHVELLSFLGPRLCPTVQQLQSAIEWSRGGIGTPPRYPIGWGWGDGDLVMFALRCCMLSNAYNDYYTALFHMVHIATGAVVQQCCDGIRDLALPCSLISPMFGVTLAGWRDTAPSNMPNTIRFGWYSALRVGTGAGHRVRLPSCLALMILLLSPGGYVTLFQEGYHAGW